MSKTYTCSAGETFDLVALRHYGDERYAYHLLEANPQLCHKLTFDGGEVLTVPAIESETNDEDIPVTPPPWKQ